MTSFSLKTDKKKMPLCQEPTTGQGGGHVLRGEKDEWEKSLQYQPRPACSEGERLLWKNGLKTGVHLI